MDAFLPRLLAQRTLTELFVEASLILPPQALERFFIFSGNYPRETASAFTAIILEHADD